MSSIRFKTVVGPDGMIHAPEGVQLPQGEIEVSINPLPEKEASLESRARDLAMRRGYSWDTLPDDVRAILMDDVQYEERGLRPPRPGPGACQGMVVSMAPDFDAPLEDLKEYME